MGSSLIQGVLSTICMTLSRDTITIDGFGLVIGFVDHLQIVTKSNCNTIVNSHTLKFTTAPTKTSQSAVSSPVVAR
jgi:hypothetical protein